MAVTNLPQAQRSAANRARQLSPLLSTVDRPVARSYLDYLTQRANRGQTPAAISQSIAQIRAAQTGEAQVPAPESSPFDVLGNVKRNLGQLTSVVPRLFIPHYSNPLFKEITKIPKIGEEYSAAIEEGANPVEALAQAPGVRLIPGAYTVGNIAGGNVEELATNPLFTALDVLPYAKWAASSRPAFQTAISEFNKALPQQLDEAAAAPVRTLLAGEGQEGINPTALNIRRPGPFRTALTRKLNEQGQVVPNRLGEIGETARASAFSSPTAQKLAGFGLGEQGRINRRLMRLQNQVSDTVRLLQTGDERALEMMRNPQVADLVRRQVDMDARYADMDTASINDRMAKGEWTGLQGREREYAMEYRNWQRDEMKVLAEEFPDEVAHIVDGSFGNRDITEPLLDELIRRPAMRNVTKADRALTRARGKLNQARSDYNSSRGRFFGPRDPFTGRESGTVPTTRRINGRNQPVNPQAVPDLYQSLADIPNSTPMGKVAQQMRREMRAFASAVDSPKKAREALIRLRAHLDKDVRGKDWERYAPLLDDARAIVKDSMMDLAQIDNKAFRSQIKAEAKAAERLQREVQKAMPARFLPRVQDDFVKSMDKEVARLEEVGFDMSAARESMASGIFKDLPNVDPNTIKNLQRELTATWTDLKMSGHDPIFIHKVSPEAAKGINYPKIGDRLITPSQVKDRTWDFSPSVDSPQIAMAHQTMELLRDLGVKEVVDTMVASGIAKSETALLAEWTETYARLGHENPAGLARKTINDSFTPWDPKSMPYLKSSKAVMQRGGKAERYYIPKTLEAMTEMIRTPPAQRLSSVLDPFMKVFRTAVLPLSVRWQVNNAMGGAMLAAIQQGPGVFKFLNEARRMNEGQGFRRAMRDENVPRPSTVPRGAPPTRAGQSGMVNERILRDPTAVPPLSKAVIAQKWFANRTKSRLWDEIQETGGSWSQKAGRFVDAQYALNSQVDDVYRTMVSLDQLEKARKAGKKVREAEFEAIEAVRKSAQSWDELLPAERVILRSVFPFYSWSRFLLNTSMRYPFDHPLRTAVVGSFARAEIEDMGTGLPDSFMGLFQINGVNENGDAHFLNLRGMNPFRDLSDWVDIHGFVGQTNPVISAALQSLGVDPMTGGPELYPEMTYDPATGRLKAKTPGFGESLMSSILPQSRVVQNYVLGNREWNELVQRDPGAAGRALMGQLGLPVLVQKENVPQAIFSAEKARYESFTEARRNAVKSGDVSGLISQYPALEQYREQIEMFTDQEALKPPTPQRRPWELVGAAV